MYTEKRKKGSKNFPNKKGEFSDANFWKNTETRKK